MNAQAGSSAIIQWACISTHCIAVQAIPKLLWDLGSAKPAMTHTALALLHAALRFAPVGSALSSALDSLQPQLCPFYCSLLTPKSSKSAPQVAKDGAKASKIVVPGPLAQLPADSQVGFSRCCRQAYSTCSEATIDKECHAFHNCNTLNIAGHVTHSCIKFQPACQIDIHGLPCLAIDIALLLAETALL